MTISVVTISLNQRSFLDECLASVRAQDIDEDIEHVVVDPGSTDGSRELLAAHADSVHAVLHPDAGPADGLNRGFEAARGDLVLYVNADDFLLPGALRAAREVARRTPEVDVFLGRGWVVDSTGQPLRAVVPTAFSPRRYALGVTVMIQPSTVIRTSAFRRTRGFRVTNRTCWDGELLVDLALAGAVVGRVDRALACFRLHDTSISGTGRLNTQFAADQGQIAERVLGRTPSARDRLTAVALRASGALGRRVQAALVPTVPAPPAACGTAQ